MENRDKSAYSWLSGKISSHSFRVYLALAAIVLLSSVISVVNYTFKYEMIWDNDEGEFIYNSYLVSSGMKIYDFFYSFQKTPGIVLVGVPVVSLFGNGFLSLFIVRVITLMFKMLAIVFVFLIGKKLKNEYVGLFAALFFGIDSIINAEGGLFTPDIYTTFFAVLSIYMYLSESAMNKVLAGFFIGIAFLFRPNSLIVPVAIFAFEMLNDCDFRAKVRSLFLVAGGFALGVSPLFLYLLYYGLLYKFFISVWTYNLHYPLGNYTFYEIIENILYHGAFKNALAWLFGLIGIILLVRLKELRKWRLVVLWGGFYLLSFFLWRSYTAGYLTDFIPPLALVAGYGAYKLLAKNEYLEAAGIFPIIRADYLSRFLFVSFILLFFFTLMVNFAIPFFDLNDLHQRRVDSLNMDFRGNVSLVTSDLGMLFLLGVTADIDSRFYEGKERTVAYKTSGLEEVYGERKIDDIIVYLEEHDIELLIFNSLEFENFLDQEARGYILENYEPVYYHRDSAYDQIKFRTKKLLRKFLLFADTEDSSLDYFYFKKIAD